MFDAPAAITDADLVYFPNMATKFVLRQSPPKTQTTENPIIGEYIFSGNIFTIGSDAANNLVLSAAAPEQMVVMREDGRLTLINSADGTKLNDVLLRREAIEPLAGGDAIQIGDYVVSVVEAAHFPANGNGASASATATNSPFEERRASQLPDTATPPKQPATVEEAKNARNFADVLDTLRTEEDSFYFIRQNPNGETTHVPLEDVATPIGETTGGDIAFTIAEISAIYAVARKDWSGILLESQRRGAVFVNDEPVEATRRLRNDDRVSFSSRVKVSFVLHEPSSLVALESLLSARVDSGAARFGGLAANPAAAADVQKIAPDVPKQKKAPAGNGFFSQFSFVEIASMVIGTLIGAVLFFLLFELVFS